MLQVQNCSQHETAIKDKRGSNTAANVKRLKAVNKRRGVDEVKGL